MSSTKKDKGASAPEAKECANCLAPDGRHGVTLKACTRCKTTHYCGRACQTTHWKAGHKRFCVTPEDRVPQLPPEFPSEARISAHNWREELESAGANECPICLELLDSNTSCCTLPCYHTFHASCVKELRSFGVKQVCPMCRAELPPGPEQISGEATRRFFYLKRTWGSLTKVQKKMQSVTEMWRSEPTRTCQCSV